MNKILIVTMPLGLNYGGILQAYALQKLLQNQSFEVDVLRWVNYYDSKLRWKLSVCRRIINKFFFKKTISLFPDYLPLKYLKRVIVITENFIRKHITLTQNTYKTDEKVLTDNELLKYNIYISGSDQVFASTSVNNYVIHCMFDFVCDKSDIKRISYAASFGHDVFCTDPIFISECKKLLKKFDAISVREDSGVKLCRELFDVEATHVIDPTMFFDSEHYIQLSKERSDYFNDGDCFTYILDKTDEKQRIINRICQKYNLKPFNVMPKSKFSEVGPKHIEDCIMPPVEQWLDGFNKAKFVITDSFHGCVFSIIFKKPFIAIGNSERGMARFESLLRMFKLEDRLIHSESDLTEQLLNSEIDYGAVHGILAKEREKAKMFLIKALS